jgi:predicted adenylyl cyclase CyaB
VSIRPIKEWLRLRNENGKYSINYKNWHSTKNGKAYSCDEFETHIDDLNTIKKLFTALDIKPLVKVDKIRKTWNYKEYEISIDIVEKLGTFVEIEFKGKSNNHKKITDDMIEFLKKLGVGKIQRDYQGYPFSMLFPNEVEYYDE